MTRIDESEIHEPVVQEASCIMEYSSNYTSYSNRMNDEAVIYLKDLCEKDEDEINEDMQDWETYMYCKEAEEKRKATVEDLPPVRPNGELFAENIIYFKVLDPQSKTKDIAQIRSENEPDTRSFEPHFVNVEMRSDENWDDETFRESFEVREEKAKCFKAKGNVAYNLKEYETACQLYSTCISYGIDAINVDVHNNRAQTYMKLGNFTAAISDLNETLKSKPGNVKALFRRALCRKEMRMYREALKDLDDLSRFRPQDTAGKNLRAEIEKILSTLTGKSYRLRETFGSRETFQVEESQLMVYAEEDQEYLLEVDKNGCLKKCVCNHCTSEDRPSFQSSNRLRIERPKWKPLTPKLLEDIGIGQKLSGSDDSGPKENGNISKAKTVKNVLGSTVSANTAKSNNTPLLNGTNGPPPTAQNTRTSWSAQNERAKLARRRVRSTADLMRMKNYFEMKERAACDSEDISKVAPVVRSGDAKTADLQNPTEENNDEMHETELTRSLNSVCKNYNLPDQWEQILEHLQTLTQSKSFTNDVQGVDKRTLIDVSNFLNVAVNLKLERANELKKLFSS